jgi:hypothetical protein
MIALGAGIAVVVVLLLVLVRSRRTPARLSAGLLRWSAEARRDGSHDRRSGPLEMSPRVRELVVLG